MSILKRVRQWLAEPMLRDVDIDGAERIPTHRRILGSKPMLKGVLDETYRLLMRLDQRHFAGDGKRIEIGAGVSGFKALFPEIVTTDVVAAPHLDMVLDAEHMQLADGSVRAIFGMHCFHHLGDPDQFFRELHRVLQPGGGCVLIEPYHGPVAARFFRVMFDSETFDKTQRDWRSDTGVMANANQALSWIVFRRDRTRFLANHPELEIVAEHWLGNYVRYLLSGGLNFRQLMPSFTIPLWQGVEWLLWPIGRWTALHHYIVLRKRSSPAVR